MADQKSSKKTNKAVVLLIDFIVTAGLIVADQLLKRFAQTQLKGNSGRKLIEHVVELYYVENRGSAFGLLEGQKILILFVSVVVMAFLLFLLLRLPQEKKFLWMHLALVLVISGGIGNCIDRVRLDYVVDYFSLLFIKFPVFNLADICVVVGVILMFLLLCVVFKEQDLEFLRFKRNRYREIDK